MTSSHSKFSYSNLLPSSSRRSSPPCTGGHSFLITPPIITSNYLRPFQLATTTGLGLSISQPVRVGGFERSIDFALAHGSNVNDVCNDGVTALMICVQRGNLEASCYLLDLGADPMLTLRSGHTAFNAAESGEMNSLLLKATEAFNPKKPSDTLPPPAPEPTPTTTTTTAATTISRTPPADNGATGPVFLIKTNPKSCDTCGLLEVMGEPIPDLPYLQGRKVLREGARRRTGRSTSRCALG